MSNKFWRTARETAYLFCLEYEEDPDVARSNLHERLEGQRLKIKQWTKTLIENRIPGVELW